MKMTNSLSGPWSRTYRVKPFMWFDDVFQDFDRHFENRVFSPGPQTQDFHPSCDIKETKNHFLLNFDMPGFKRDQIKVEVQDGELIVSGERHQNGNSENGETSLRHERLYGSFERTFSLPTSANAEKIEAHYEDGVLSVLIPKAEVAKARSVQIQTGSSGFFGKLLGEKTQ